MNAYSALLVATSFALPIGYIASCKASSTFQQALVATLWAIFLSIQVTNDGANLHSQETMLFSVMVFILPLKLTQQILYPKKSGKKNVTVRDFVLFAASLFYFALPVSRAKEIPNRREILLRNLHYVVVICFKLVLIPVVDAASRQLAQEEPDSETRSTRTYWTLLCLFCSSIVAGTWVSDVQCVIIDLLSAGRFEMLPFNNYPFLSKSIGEFWARRYNLLMHSFFSETVYIPAQTYHGLSKWVASILVFVASGVLHSWVAYFTFGRGMGRAFLFFVVQVPWIMLESKFSKQLEALPAILRILLTTSFCFWTSSIYTGLFVDAYPDWLEKNDPTVPDLPVLARLSKKLIELLQLDPQYLR